MREIIKRVMGYICYVLVNFPRAHGFYGGWAQRTATAGHAVARARCAQDALQMSFIARVDYNARFEWFQESSKQMELCVRFSFSSNIKDV